jgi:transcriptional regulator of heat shock response
MRWHARRFGSADDRPMYVEGASSLLDDATGLNVQTLQALLQMIEEKQTLLRC